MRNSETGEFELVVGNRQLLSGFFIVVLLFAVMFSMGYIVGRNSSPSAKLQAEAASGAPAEAKDARPQPSAPAPVSPAASVAAAPAQTADGTGQPPPADSTPQPTTQPAQPSPGVPAPQTATAPPEPAAPAESVTGSYWQVMAVVDQHSAEVVVRTLKDKGFPASMSPGPNNLMRVLVGPYQDTKTLGKAKTELENLGFTAVMRK